MESITISKHEYEQLRKKSAIIDLLDDFDLEFIRQVLNSKEDLKHGRFKRLA